MGGEGFQKFDTDRHTAPSSPVASPGSAPSCSRSRLPGRMRWASASPCRSPATGQRPQTCWHVRPERRRFRRKAGGQRQPAAKSLQRRRWFTRRMSLLPSKTRRP